MLGGRVIETRKDYRGTSTTEVVQAESANVVLDMGNGVRIEIPIDPAILVTTFIEDGGTYIEPHGRYTMRMPDRVHLARLEVNPRGGDEMFRLFRDFQEAEEPHDEMCDCGNH